MDEEKLHDESQPATDEAKAQRIEEEARGLKWCLKHELVVWYDGQECPVCQMQNEEREQAAKEFLALTEERLKAGSSPWRPGSRFGGRKPIDFDDESWE